MSVNGDNEIIKSRYRYLDIARGLCMISIVLGHLGNSYINRFVFTYHLPVFFLISGYFTRKERMLPHIKKRIRTLIIPYYFSSIMIMLSYFFISKIYKVDKNEIITRMWLWVKAMFYAAGDNWNEPFNIPGIGAIWFLWAIFLGGIIFQGVLRLKPRMRVFVVVILLYLANYSVEHLFFFPLSIQPACSAVFYLYCGYLWKENKDYIYKFSSELKAFLVAVSSTLWLYFIVDFDGFWLVHSYYGRGIVNVLGSLCASFIVILISKYVLDRKSRIIDLFAYLGRYSIIFLSIHIVELSTFRWHDIIGMILGDKETPMKYLYLVIFLKLVLIISLTFIFSKLPYIRAIYGIKRDKNER